MQNLFNEYITFIFIIQLNKIEFHYSNTRATVIEIIGRTGSRGGITQVKVQLVGQQRTLIRNVMGPVRKGDTLELMECEREARRLR